MVVTAGESGYLPLEAPPASAVGIRGVVVTPAGAAPVSDGAGDLGQFLVVGDNRSAFSGGDVVGRIEAQCAQVAKGACVLAIEAGAQGVAGILDDKEFPLLG